MQATRRRDTKAEIQVRRLLHASGLRYRVDWPLPTNPRRRADIAFTKSRVIVFIDGCFWHRCPQHYVAPRSNEAFWDDKIKENVTRDQTTTSALEQAGWRVMRFWEHEDPSSVAAVIRSVVEGRNGCGRSQGDEQG